MNCQETKLRSQGQKPEPKCTKTPEKCMPESEEDILSVSQLSQARPRETTLPMNENVQKIASNSISNPIQVKITPKIEKLRKN